VQGSSLCFSSTVQSLMMESPVLVDLIPLVCVGFWFIWLSRNDACFKGVKVSPISCIQRIKYLMRQVELVLSGIEDKKTIITQMELSLRWEPPPSLWVRLNSDGSSLGNPGPAGAGCVLRNEHGGVLFAISQPIPHAISNMAKFMELALGLKVLAKFRHNNIIW
ncbi:hypothetical protein FRX31_031231, partial [Thalictrum thalictroides]